MIVTSIVCDGCGKPFPDIVMLKCTLPGTSIDDEQTEWLCPTCNDGSDYCKCCGEFCAGIDSFEFLHPGYCDNCFEQLQEDVFDDDFEDYTGEDDHFFERDKSEE